MNFPSRVRVVKKIPSTGRVTSTRHSLHLTHEACQKIENYPNQYAEKDRDKYNEVDDQNLKN